MEKYEISKMITLCTIHIPEELADNITDLGIAGIVVYEKREFGWFIFVDYHEMKMREVPKSLRPVILLAKKQGCDWICLDGDGLVLDELPVYERKQH